MNKIFILLCLIFSISSFATQGLFIEKTGILNYKTTKMFTSSWKTTCNSPKDVANRWKVVSLNNGSNFVLSSGLVRKANMPLKHVVYEQNGQKTLFDVSNSGNNHAFKASCNFFIQSTWKKPIEKVYVSLAAVSLDNKQSYTAAFYSNAGKDVFTKNNLRIDIVDFTTGKIKNILYKSINQTLDPKKWYNLAFSMTRNGDHDRAPVILKVTLSEVEKGKIDGKKTKELKTFSTKLLPNLGNAVQFGIIEPSTVYKVYLANICAESKTAIKKTLPPKKAATKLNSHALKWKNYFFQRKNEYKKLNGTLNLAKNGKANCVIVIKEDAPPPVRYAAIELKNHLDKICNANFQILHKEQKNLIPIYLGNSGKEKLNLSNITRDGYKIKVANNTINIAGIDDNTKKSTRLFYYTTPNYQKLNRQMAWGDPLWDFERGTLYGVYKFLEILGIRWYMPGDIGTVIPKNKNLTISNFQLSENPVFDMRYISPLNIIPNIKNGPIDAKEYQKSYHALKWSGAKYMQWKLRMRCSTNYYPINHHPPRMQFEERFGASNPEYFANFNGKRSLQKEMGSGRTGALCYSNSGTIKEILTDIDYFFSNKNAKERGFLYTNTASYGMCYNNGWPYSTAYKNMVSLLPHDVFHPCSCSKCSILLSNRHAGELSDLVWKFVKDTATVIQKKWPSKLVSNLAYATYSHLPYNIDSLPSNVIIGILPCFNKLNEPYTLTNKKRFNEYFAFTQNWQKMNNMPVLFWSHWLYRTLSRREHHNVPMILPRHMTKIAQESSKYGRIMYMEADTDNFIFEHLNYYFFYKSFFNPNIDAKKLFTEYIEKFYGPAQKEMKEFFFDLEKRCTVIASHNASNEEIWSNKEMFNHNVIKHYRKLVEIALKKSGNTIYAKRVKLILDFLIKNMEEGVDIYLKSGSSVKLRQSLLNNIKTKKNVNLSNNNEVHFQLMPLVGYPDFQTSEVTLSIKNNALLINFIGKEKYLTKLKRNHKKNFANIYSDDCLEIMLVPPNMSSYYQIMVNSNGNYNIVLLGKDGNKLIDKYQFKLSINSSIAPEANNWSLDIKIPLEQFAAKDLQNTWKFNIFRNRRIDNKKEYQASGIYLKEHHFHKINEYLTLKLK